MGFTTGFLGGLTVTYGVAYLTLHAHRQHRASQHTILHQSNTILRSFSEPQPPAPERPAFEVKKLSTSEMLKDRWNREVQELARGLQETDWTRVREDWEGRISALVRRFRQDNHVEGEKK